MKIQNIIFCWNRVYDEVLKIYENLKDNNINVEVINSSNKIHQDWDNVGDDYWCYGQTYKAFKKFDDSNDYLNIIFGDVEYDNFTTLIKSTESILESNDNIGIFAPDYGNKKRCWWTIENTSVDMFDDENQIVLENPNLVVSTMCDFFCIAIHKDLVKEYNKFLDYFVEKYENFPLWKGSGYGTGTILCIMCHLNNNLICRSKDLVVGHSDISGGFSKETVKYYDIILDEYKKYMGNGKAFDSKRKLVMDRCGKYENKIIDVNLSELWSINNK